MFVISYLVQVYWFIDQVESIYRQSDDYLLNCFNFTRPMYELFIA